MRCVLNLLAGIAVLGLMQAGPASAQPAGACPAPAPVCAVAERVFPISAAYPVASAVLIEPGLLVTNRHVVANLPEARVTLPDGTQRTAEVVPSAYPGDLILLRAEGLGAGAAPLAVAPPAAGTALHTVGHDVGRGAIRVYDAGTVLAVPPADKPLARLHHTAPGQPGNSGGALVDAAGRLAGIVTAGGEGRHDAMLAADIAKLKAQSGPDHVDAHLALGLAYRQCTAATEAAAASRQAMRPEQVGFLIERCRASRNRQLFDLAAQALGRRGHFDESVGLFEASLAQDPNAVNARLGLVVTLHLAKRYADEVPHLRKLIAALPADVQVLRFAIQAGTWAGAPDLAKQGMTLLEQHHPKLAPLARRFMETPPPR